MRTKAVLLSILLSLSPALGAGQDVSGGNNSAAAFNTRSTSVTTSIAGLSDVPFAPGQIVHIQIFEAPEFNEATPVSQSGDIPFQLLGSIHLQGLNSDSAAELIRNKLKDEGFILDPHVLVTVEGGTTGITVLGEVKSPGVYSPPVRHQLADILSLAGGLTTTAGRVIEVSSPTDPAKKVLLAWDPTLHSTASANVNIEPGQTVFVRRCGLIYVGGNVAKPGGYPICGSPTVHLSEAVAMAGGVLPLSSSQHSILLRTNPDGTRVVAAIRLDDVLRGRSDDIPIREEDIVYIPQSTTKITLKRLADVAVGFSGAAFYYFAEHT